MGTQSEQYTQFQQWTALKNEINEDYCNLECDAM
jgi:hypothetical protein